jgi:hypothetical protein
MAEDLVDHRRIFDGGDDLQGAAAVRAVFHIDIEDPFEQARPTDAGRRRAVCSVSVIIARVSGVDGLAWDDLGPELGHWVRARRGSGSSVSAAAAPVRPVGSHELQRRHHHVGGAVAVGALKPQYHIANAVTLEPLVGDRRAGDVTAQPFRARYARGRRSAPPHAG